MELPKTYDPKTVEQKWTQYWHDHNLHAYDPKKSPVYTIDTPPPTISGKIHIGHAFSYSQQDFLARYQRMKGRNVFFPFGIDNNGLPTERMVEKLKKVKSTAMGRAEFIKLCQNTLTTINKEITQSCMNLGMSCDFHNPYATIDPHCIKTSQLSFIQLHKKGLIYRKDAPSIWCVHCQTAIAQAELEDKELKSTFNDVVFKIDNQEVIIATTRPELIPACVCVYVHPDDKRYTSLVGKKASIPLFNYDVPVFADSSADPEKGSGAMMVCSYGDRYDVEAIQTRNLQPRVVFTKNGKLNSNAGKYDGMRIKDARKAILDDLEKEGLLKEKKPIRHVVNVHDKCGTEIEFLATPQWFVNVIDHKDEFLAAGDKINWYPASMKKRFQHWVENLNWDWNISRQRHFGVPFPVWFKKDGTVVLAKEEDLPVDPTVDKPAGHDDVIADEEVMDTWATSSMTPQIVTNWIKNPERKEEFSKTYPTSLRPQGHDIIRTWAFYTIVKSLYHHNTIPWENIAISGNVADPAGQKMSKSKGNVVEPQDVIDAYSTDALRFWAAGSKLGEDLPFLEKDIVTGKKTTTKLWNAAKFVFMQLGDYEPKETTLTVIDEWLVGKLNKVIKDATEAFEQYEYSKCKLLTEQFFWNVFCDYYLEIVKDRTYNDTRKGKEAAQWTLYTSLLKILKLFAPIMPYITEEVYHAYYHQHEKTKSIHISEWPVEHAVPEKSLAIGEMAVAIIGAVRKYKSEQKVSLKKEIALLTIDCSQEDQAKLTDVLDDIKATTNAQKVDFGVGKIVTDVDSVKIEVLLT